MKNLSNLRIALVYDRINKWGGAERVLLALHKLFPNAPLYTAVYNTRKASWAKVFDIKTSFIQKLPFASRNHELLPFFMPLAFESFSFDEYDLVISVTSEAAKGIITKPRTLHICYCLTPTRYLWSGYEDYFPRFLMKLATRPVVSYLKRWDKQAAQRPDVFIAVSKEVQGRIKKYYDRESEVVYPPVEISKIPTPSRFESGLRGTSKYERSKTQMKDQNYFLIVSRLVQYKKIDLAIEVCNELKLPLKIIGVGSDEKRLRNISGETISFVGSVSDEELASYYASCQALIFPGCEDFGIAMAEAMSFGKPIIAFKGGGALEIISENKTGLFFYPQNKDALKNALLQFNSEKIDPDDCKKQAEKFRLEMFKNNFLEAINRVL